MEGLMSPFSAFSGLKDGESRGKTSFHFRDWPFSFWMQPRPALTLPDRDRAALGTGPRFVPSCPDERGLLPSGCVARGSLVFLSFPSRTFQPTCSHTLVCSRVPQRGCHTGGSDSVDLG